MARSLIATDPNARPSHFRNLFEECIFVFTAMMATASTTFIQGVIIINTEGIGRDLNMSSAQITWIAAAVGLASGSFMLVFGKIADSFGFKPQLLFGMALLGIASLITAFVPSALSMNILCGFLGLGTAAVSPPAVGTLFATYPEGRRRNKVTGALGAGNPVGFVLGSISSGLSAKYSNWRTSFIVISIFFGIMTLLAIWTMPSVPRTGNTKQMIRQFDYLGTILIISGMALLSAGLTEGPSLGWTTFKPLLLLFLGLTSLLTLTLWSTQCQSPLLDPVLFKNTTFTLCVLSVAFGYMSFITNQFWLTLYMQTIQKLSPLTIAIRLMPQTIAGIVWSYIGQALISKVPGRTIMAIGGFAYLVGATMVYFIKPETSYWMLLFPALCVTVVGADFQFIVSNLYISTQMPSQSSLGAGVLQTGMRLSVTLGLSLTSAIYGSTQTSTTNTTSPTTLPFSRAYLVSILFAAVSLLFIPFMNMPSQGKKSGKHGQPYGTIFDNNRSHTSSSEEDVVEHERPRTGGEYFDGEYFDGVYYDVEQALPYHQNQYQYQYPNQNLTADELRFTTSNYPLPHHLRFKGSEASLWSAATAGSMDSYFPRWSWEGDGGVGIGYSCGGGGEGMGQSRGESVVYEVCIKCLEERKVLVSGVGGGVRSRNIFHGGNASGWNVRRDERGRLMPFFNPPHQHLHEHENERRDQSREGIPTFDPGLRIGELLNVPVHVDGNGYPQRDPQRRIMDWAGRENLSPVGDPSWGMGVGLDGWRGGSLRSAGARGGNGGGEYGVRENEMGMGYVRRSAHPVDGLLFYLNRYERLGSRDCGALREEGERGGGRRITPRNGVGPPVVGERRSSWGKGLGHVRTGMGMSGVRMSGARGVEGEVEGGKERTLLPSYLNVYSRRDLEERESIERGDGRRGWV